MEIGKLQALFTADTKNFDAGMLRVKSGVADVSTGLTGLQSNLGAVLGVSTIATGIIAGVGASLFGAARSAAAFGGGLTDLSQRTGITVGTLSALKVAADQSGGSIETVNKSLGKYLANISDASNGNEELQKKMESVGFTAEDLNKAYGNSDTAVSILVKKVQSLGNEQDQLNLLQKVGVKNGQELNGVINGMTGNLEEFRKEAERLGLVITPEQAKAADKFDDTLKLLELQVKGMSYSIANQYLPQISGAMADISAGLASNKGAWASWGEFIKTEIRGVRIAASFLSGVMAGSAAGNVGAGGILGIFSAVQKSRQLHGEEFAANNIGSSLTFGGSLGGVRRGGGGGGVGGGGGRGGGGRGISGAKESSDLFGFDEAFRNIEAHLRKVREENEKIISDILATPVSSIEALIKLYDALSGGFDAGHRALVGGGLSTATGQLEALIGLGAPDAGPLEAANDALNKVRDQMQRVAGDITQTFSDALYDGISGGGLRGLQSLSLGFLDMIQEVVLGRLKKSLAEALGGAASGGGNWFTKYVLPAFGIAAGGVSGSTGFSGGAVDIGSFVFGAKGGMVPGVDRGYDSVPTMLRPGEMVLNRQQQSGMGQTVHNHYNTFNLPPASKGSYASPKSQRELAGQLADFMQSKLR